METQIVALPKGAKVMETLTTWCEENDVHAAIISAVGAVANAEICFYDLPTKTYNCVSVAQPHEVVSFNGNVAIKEGKPFIHAHCALGDSDCNLKGGHLKEATVAVTLECMITPIEGDYERTLNEDIGLFLLPNHD